MWKYMSLLSSKFDLLVVLDVVHKLGDTPLMVLEERASHNWVQADEGKFSGFSPQKSCLSDLNKGTEPPHNLGFSQKQNS